jgi:flavin reductase (DIM6/NTAB) family NADH-FMN oxidoreductase RutF
MTARQTADDIIPAPVTRTRGAFSESVPAAEFRAALTGLTTAVSIIATNGLAGIAGRRVAFDCELMEARQFGAHSVLIARVLATAQGAPAEPLVHHRQQYATTRAL